MLLEAKRRNISHGINKGFIQSLKRGRTLRERLTDQFLLLSLLDDADRNLGATKIHKLAFLSELEMNLQARKGFNFNFIKLDYGPYSTDVKYDLNHLRKSNIITDSRHRVKSNGKMILDSFSHLLKINEIFIEKIHEVNQFFADIPRDKLVRMVHSMPNPLRPWITIHDTPSKKYLLKRIRLIQPDRAFILSESDEAALEFYFDPKSFQSLKNSLRIAKSEPAVKLSEVVDIV